MAATLKQIIERLVNAGATTSPTTLTASSGSTTTFADTSATFDKTSTTAYQGRVLWVTANANSAGNAPENQARAVSTFTTATNLLTIPAFSSAIEASDTAVLLPPGWGKDMTLDSINDAIRTVALPRYLPATYVSDGDMEVSTTSSWTDIGSPTKTKDTGQVLTGRRSLKLVTTVITTGASTVINEVTPGTPFLFATTVYVSAGSVQAQVYDSTNGATICTLDFDELNSWAEGRIQGTIPETCWTVLIRYVCTTASSTWYVDNSIFLPTDRDIYDFYVGTTDLDPARIENFYCQREGQGSDTNTFAAFASRLQPIRFEMQIRDYKGVIPFRVQLGRISEPIWYMFREADTALSAMADTTVFPLEALVSGALSEVYKRLYNRFDDPLDKQRGMESARAFKAALDELGISQPIIRASVQKRVYV
jgi:hypothetical protein